MAFEGMEGFGGFLDWRERWGNVMNWRIFFYFIF
jgi:hypothetical protein